MADADPPTYDEAYRRGITDAWSGRDYTDSPYSIGSVQRYAWLSGFSSYRPPQGGDCMYFDNTPLFPHSLYQ